MNLFVDFTERYPTVLKTTAYLLRKHNSNLESHNRLREILYKATKFVPQIMFMRL